MSEMQLTNEQQSAVTERGGALLVSAAAGSGKTKVLTERLLARVTGGERRDIDEFLIITYTNAAAAELRSRISRELGRRLAQNPLDRHLQRQSVLVYRAQISTVHAFCANLVKENAHILGIAPDFRIADEDERNILLSETLDDLMERRYEDIESDPDFRLLVDTMGAGRDDARLCAVVRETYAKLRSHPDPGAWAESCIRQLEDSADRCIEETVWGREILSHVAASAGYWEKKLRLALDSMRDYPELLKAYGGCFEEDAQNFGRLKLCAMQGWDEAAGLLPLRFGSLRALKNFELPELQAELKEMRKLCKDAAGGYAELLDCSSEAAAEDLSASLPAVRALMSLVTQLGEDFLRFKQGRGLVDFADLEHYALKLLVESENHAPTELAKRIAGRCCEVMVDEYQDTNRVQNLIFSAVSQNEENLFMVGDVKQSIYRFNLADPGIFLERYRAYKPAGDADGAAPRKVVLSRNFRSRPEVTDCVNFVFSNIMSTKFGEMEYGENERLRAEGTFPPADDMRAELDVLDASVYGGGTMSRSESEAGHVAKRVRELLDSGFTVTSEDGGLRPVRPGDIVILMRSPSSKSAEYIRALEGAGVRVRAGGGSFFDTVEISVMLSLLEIIDNPRQDVALISVMRSPLYGFSPDTLADIRSQSRDTDFYDALVSHAGKNGETAAFLAELDELRFRAPDMGVQELIRLIYERRSVTAVFGAMPAGKRRQENLNLLFEQAGAFESRGYRGLFSFVNWMRRLRESGGNLGRSASGGGGDAVSIMSIHKAKGLEFPVVILADTCKRFNYEALRRPLLIHSELCVGAKWLDTQRMAEYPTIARSAIALRLKAEMLAEELRLLYVAMTRPKDKLIMVTAFTSLDTAISKLKPHIQSPVAPESMESLGSVGEWLLLAALLRPEASFLLGGQKMDSYAGGWDIRLVTERGLSELPDAEREPERRRASEETLGEVRRRLNYTYPYAAACDTQSKVTATELKGRALDEEVARNTPHRAAARGFARPRFISRENSLTAGEKGIALHLVMQYIDLGGCKTLEGVKAEIRRLTDSEFISPEQSESVEPERILRFMLSPLGERLLKAESVVREFKFSVLAAADSLGLSEARDEALLQGVVDLWIEEPKGITIIDFKTDKVTEENAPERAKSYFRQVELYSMAVARMTGRPVISRVLYFFNIDRGLEI